MDSEVKALRKAEALHKVMTALANNWDTWTYENRVKLCALSGTSLKVAKRKWGRIRLDDSFKLRDYIYTRKGARHNNAKPGEFKPKDYLMWVGTKFYPTYHDFANEAAEQGLCKRIGKIPNNMIPGKSRLFLTHDEGVSGEGFIFGYAVINRLETVGEDGVTTDSDPWRKCGVRRQGGTYLIGEYIQLKKLLRFDHGRFRGALAAKGDAILASTDFRKAPSDVYKLPKKHKWTEDDEKALLKAVKKRPKGTSRLKALTIFALKSRRPKASVIYRYNKLNEA